MRIAQVSTLSTPVRRQGSGSVEGLVWLLTRELAKAGHEVTVFGTAGSQVDGTVVASVPAPHGAPGSLDDWYVSEWANLCRAVAESKNFDVVHTHAYLWGVLLQPFARAPLVHTLHVVPDTSLAQLWTMHPGASVTATSRHQWAAYPSLEPVAVIPHGVNAEDFTFRPDAEDYVCFLGRFTPGKGPLEAIAIARQLGIRLLMAGPSSNYFQSQVRPHIDGHLVEYVGPVGGGERDKLLGGARALLYPIREPEAFGLVLAEAMLCGTPVAATRLGAVPEIVDEGKTGFSVDAIEDLGTAAAKCFSLDRAAVRQQAISRFSAERMAQAYLHAYERTVARCTSS